MSDTVSVVVLPSEKIGVEVRGAPLPIGIPGTAGIVVEIVKGEEGDPGPGVSRGGAVGDILVKKTSLDYDSEWRKLVYFGTGDPPDPSGLEEGTLYFKIEE